MHFKQAYKRTSQRRQTKIVKTTGVMKRRYEKSLSYKKKNNDGKSGQSNKKLEELKEGDHM